MRNQITIYLGLFLIVFGLYAVQLKKIPHATGAATKEVAELVASTPVPAPQNRIQLLYDQLRSQKIFSNTVDGVRLFPKQPPVKSDFMITLYGDEVFSDENFAINPPWETVLDQIADLFKKELGLKMEISGYADADNLREQKPSDYGSSAFAFSYARAEWLAHYFERKDGLSISKILVLRGMGAVPQGKKIELRFYFSSGADNSGPK